MITILVSVTNANVDPMFAIIHAFVMFLMFQIYLPSHIHGGNGGKINSEGIYTEQVHLSAESMELVGLRGDYQRIRDYWDGSRESGRSQDVQGVEST